MRKAHFHRPDLRFGQVVTFLRRVLSIALITLATFLDNDACRGEEILPLPTDKPLNRIAFGSCGKEGRPQPIWKALHRGVYEVMAHANEKVEDPFFDADFRVTFIRPDGSQVTTDGFHDGDQTFRARAYCDAPGPWQWSATSNLEELNGQTGSFQVIGSSLPGKLRKHPDDSRQLVYDNGKWFLHMGHTPRRFFLDAPRTIGENGGFVSLGVIRAYVARSGG